MRDIYKAISQFEHDFEITYGLSLNEAMVLCALDESEDTMTAKALAERTGMKSSQTSKVVSATEEKGFITRTLGTVDRRQMYFRLTAKGEKRLEAIMQNYVEVPDLLKPILL